MSLYWCGWFRLVVICLFGGGIACATASLTPIEYQQLLTAYQKMSEQPSQSLQVFSRLDKKLSVHHELELKVNVGYMIVQTYQQLDNLPAAINHLSEVQKLIKPEHKLYGSGEGLLAYLYYQTKNYASCAQHGEQALTNLAITQNRQQAIQTATLAATCYFQNQSFPAAIRLIERGMSLTPQPSEAVLRFALSLYQQTQNVIKASLLLEQQLTLRFPQKKEYWQALLSLYVRRKLYAQALSTTQVMRRYITFDRALVLQQVNLYRLNRQPYQAAKALEHALKMNVIVDSQRHYALLAELFIQARARSSAIHYLTLLSKEKQGSREHPPHQLLQQIASLAHQQGDWSVVKKTLLQAQQYADHLTYQSHILLALSFMESNDWGRAQSVLKPLCDEGDNQAINLVNYIQYVSS